MLTLALVTRTPWVSAQASASTNQLLRAEKWPSHGTFAIPIRADSTGESGEIPTVPRLLLILPEMVPATSVP